MYKKLGITLLIIVLLAAGATLLIFNNRTNLSPLEVATMLYDEWLSTAQASGSPRNEGLHTRSIYVSDNLVRTIDSTVEGFDPLLCTTRPPESFQTELVNEREDTAVVHVVHDGLQDPVRVVLKKDDRGWWHAEEVDCPDEALAVQHDLERAVREAKREAEKGAATSTESATETPEATETPTPTPPPATEEEVAPVE